MPLNAYVRGHSLQLLFLTDVYFRTCLELNFLCKIYLDIWQNTLNKYNKILNSVCRTWKLNYPYLWPPVTMVVRSRRGQGGSCLPTFVVGLFGVFRQILCFPPGPTGKFCPLHEKCLRTPMPVTQPPRNLNFLRVLAAWPLHILNRSSLLLLISSSGRLKQLVFNVSLLATHETEKK